MKYLLVMLLIMVIVAEMTYVGYKQGQINAYLQFQKELESKK